jgi:imidazolonepropionase-like amidohydrolase
MKGNYLLNLLLFGFILCPPVSFCQTVTKYSVYKLENKIGREEYFQDQQGHEHITIKTNDRGQNMQLQATLSQLNGKVNYKSAGNTSRFKTENIDTAFTLSSNFPISNNGSIKLRELLISFWAKAGKPQYITSTITGRHVNIAVIGKEKNPLNGGELAVIVIKDTLDEILWIDDKGNAVYLAACDSEGDKREVINDSYSSFFNALTHRSNEYLINSYLSNNKNLGQSFNTIAIIGGNIIDVVDSGKVSYNTMLLLKNGKIDYVGKINRTLIPSDAHIIDASNKFLIPGLWNMHVHLFHPEYLKRGLLSGATTVRDMGNEFDFITRLRKAVNEGALPGPHILSAGLLDGRSPNSLGIMRAGSEQEIEENVKKYHDAGFNQIKVYSYVKKNDFDNIVKEARLYDMDVVGHLPVGYTVGYFIENGMKSISHIHYFMNSLKWAGKDFDADNKTLLDKLIEKKIYLDPTLNVYTLTGDPKIVYYNKLVKLFFDYGIPIVAGTDNEGTIVGEIQNYVKLGLSPLNAIRSTTIVSAAMMKMDKQSGSITQGKDADILLLNSNPLLDVSTLNDINTIIKGQLVIKKDENK